MCRYFTNTKSATSNTFTQDAAQRPLGPPAVWVNPFTDFKRFFGITGWGFTKANELFHGRLAMIGFAAALVQEGRLGGVGPLALVSERVSE
jgi:photosystem II protein